MNAQEARKILESCKNGLCPYCEVDCCSDCDEAQTYLAALKGPEVAGLVEAVERISHAKPDELNPQRDIELIRRAAKIAGSALAAFRKATEGV